MGIKQLIEKELFKGFKALGEPSRMQIIKMLALQSMCVCELSEVLNMSQPRVSQHLRTLKDAGLVTEQKEGYWTRYSFEREALKNLYHELTTFLDADLKDLEGYEEIYERYRELPYNERVRGTKEKLKRCELQINK